MKGKRYEGKKNSRRKCSVGREREREGGGRERERKKRIRRKGGWARRARV